MKCREDDGKRNATTPSCCLFRPHNLAMTNIQIEMPYGDHTRDCLWEEAVPCHILPGHELFCFQEHIQISAGVSRTGVWLEAEIGFVQWSFAFEWAFQA